MLKAFRSGKGASIIVKGLMGLLVLSFAVWGIGDIFSPNSAGQSVAEAGDTEISQQEFLFNLRRQQAQLRASGFSDDMLAGVDLNEVVIGQLVTRAVYEEEARAMNVVATDQVIGRTIRETEAFQDAAGNFDRNRYEFSLNNQGYNPAYFENLISKEVVANILLDSISAGIKVSDVEADTLYRYQKEKRNISFVKIAIDDHEVIAEPTADALNEYYDTNKERFRAPDYRKISYIAIDPDQMAQNIEIDELRLKETYNQRADAFSTPEKRTILQMLLPDEASAQAALAQIKSGKTFADVALEVADQGADEINLGTMTRVETPDANLGEAAFALELGGVSNPVESLFGWYLLSVTDIEEGVLTPFADVSEELRKEVAREQAVTEAYDISNQLDDTLAGGATLEEASEQMGLNVVVLEGIDNNGINMQGDFLTSLPNPASFLKFAFETEESLDSLMQDDGADGFFILRVDNLIATRIKSLDEVRDEAIALWDAEQRRNKAKVEADALVAQLNAGESLQAVMTDGVEIAELYDRNGNAANGAKLPTAMATSLFDIERGQSSTSYSDNAYTIAQVDEVIIPMPNADSKDIEDNISEVALAGMSSDLIEQYNMALRERHSVTINRSLMNNIVNMQHNYN